MNEFLEEDDDYLQENFYWDHYLAESSGLEELPNVETFGCKACGNVWRTTYIEGKTDI